MTCIAIIWTCETTWCRTNIINNILYSNALSGINYISCSCTFRATKGGTSITSRSTSISSLWSWCTFIIICYQNVSCFARCASCLWSSSACCTMVTTLNTRSCIKVFGCRSTSQTFSSISCHCASCAISMTVSASTSSTSNNSEQFASCSTSLTVICSSCSAS